MSFEVVIDQIESDAEMEKEQAAGSFIRAA